MPWGPVLENALKGDDVDLSIFPSPCWHKNDGGRYIGTMNVACIAGLALFQVGKETSVPFSWFYWASQWAPVTLVGLFYLQREGLSLRSLGQAREGPA